MAVKQLKDGRCAIYYQLDGKKKWEFFGRGELAQLKAQKRDEQIREEKGKLKPSVAITVGQLLNEYHSKHVVENSTADSDFYRIDRILKPALGRYFAETLSTDQVDTYVKARLDAGRSPETVKRELGILKSAYSWGGGQAASAHSAESTFQVSDRGREAAEATCQDQSHIDRRLQATAPACPGSPRASHVSAMVWRAATRKGGPGHPVA